MKGNMLRFNSLTSLYKTSSKENGKEAISRCAEAHGAVSKPAHTTLDKFAFYVFEGREPSYHNFVQNVKNRPAMSVKNKSPSKKTKLLGAN